jgi:hypothetical protein
VASDIWLKRSTQSTLDVEGRRNAEQFNLAVSFRNYSIVWNDQEGTAKSRPKFISRNCRIRYMILQVLADPIPVTEADDMQAVDSYLSDSKLDQVSISQLCRF